MANHYTLFSQTLIIRNLLEKSWLQRQLSLVYLTQSKQIFATESRQLKQLKQFGVTYEELPRFQAEAIQSGVTDCALDCLGFQWAFEQEDDEGQSLWLYAEESGDVEQVAYFVRTFLCKFAPDGWWTLTWAHSCSRPLLGQFSGGALLVTSKEVSFLDTTRWLETQQSGLSLAHARQQ